MRSVFVFIGLFLFAGSVYANQKTASIQIKSIEGWTTTGGDLLITTSESQKTNPANCSFNGNYGLPANVHDIYKSMVLTAFTTKNPIRFVIWGGGCLGSRPQIVSIELVE